MLKKERGFTLIELMIVIASISLLMIALIPATGLIKNKVKEVGIKSNMLMVEGIIQNILIDYASIGVNTFEYKVEEAINSVTIDSQKIRNPITGKYNCGNWDMANTAVAYANGDSGNNGKDIDDIWTSPLSGSAGCVVYAAYMDTTVTPNRMCVKLIAYGANNRRITALERVITE